jgi:hypothetical protein
MMLALRQPVLAQEPAPLKTVNLCDVMHAPEGYSGSRLTMRAIVLGQHTDRLLVIWPECQFGMHLIIPREIESHADVQLLFKAVQRGNPGTTDKDITRTFTGTFHYSKEGSVFELIVESIAPSINYEWPK